MAVLLALPASACGGGPADREPRPAERPKPAVDRAGFSARVDNPLFPLASVGLTVFEGTERDPETDETLEIRVESRVRKQPERVSGIPVTVVDVRDYEDGELVERTRDFYAQKDGSVFYIGEDVDDYENGKLVGHGGEWRSGENGASPGLFMPAKPTVGMRFAQETAPGVAEDRSKVVAVGVDVRTPAGRFSDCIKTEDFAPLDNLTQLKYYCPGIGLVREEPTSGGRFELVRYR